MKAIELLKNELEEVKKEMLLAVIFFDGEDRSKIEYYKNKKKGIENLLKDYEAKEKIKEIDRDLDKLEKAINERSRIIKK